MCKGCFSQIGIHRPSIVTTNKRLNFRTSLSLPESSLPPAFEEFEESYESTIDEQDIDFEEGMAKLAGFLEHLGLDKYYEAFEARNIDFNQLLQLSSEDIKEIIDKMGPRRRLELAVKQVKEELHDHSTSDSFRQGDTTPTPNRDHEDKDLKVQIMRLQSALNQATQNLESCEHRLSKEYELRKMSERYCQELQQCRAQTLDAVKSLKETQASLLKQCQSLKSSHKKLQGVSRKFDSTDDIDPSLHHACHELLTSVAGLGGEIEAVTRTAQQSNRDYKAINYQLNSFMQ